MKQFSPGKLICGIITIILTLSCLLMIAIGISEIRDSASVPSYYLDEEDYISTLQQEDYMNLYDMTCRDCIPDKKLSSNIKACQAVARYYQAATLYKAYVLTGDNLAITRQVQQMEQYAAQTGNYSDYVEKINQLLELDSLHTGKLPPIKSEERTGKFSCCCHSSEVPLRSGIRGIREGLMRHMPMWNADVTGCCIICCMGINRVLFVLAGMKIRIVFFSFVNSIISFP